MAKFLLFRAQDLNDYMVRFFVKLNVPKADAETAAEVLLSADLRGVDSHGIIRLNTYYGDRLRRGLIDPLTPIKVLNETPVTLALSAGNGMGQVAGKYAMTRAIEKAKQNAVGMVTVCDSNHYGIAGYYAMMALEHNLIGISYTNSQPLVAPTYGRKALIGTNPIAVAVPAGDQRPYVLDMATSIVPIGRITVYDKAGKPIPEGWGIDGEGRVTTNPAAVLKGGALMPLGGIDVMRGYKGYGLGLLVDIFSGVLAGAGFAAGVGAPATLGRFANVGHFFMAVNIEAFRPVNEFKHDMDDLITQLKQSPKAAGQNRIYIHGEKEFERAERTVVEGIPLLANVVQSLQEAGTQIGVDWNLPQLGEKEEEE